MGKIDWRNFFELVGLVAIVLSLIFVGLQMRQDQILARSELGAGTVEAFNDLGLTATDPEFARAFAKMLNEPDNLTDDEMIQINSYLIAAKSLFIRECYLVSRGVFSECTNFIKSNAGRFFGSRYAQSWWRLNWAPNPYLPDWVNDEVTGLGGDTNQQRLRELRESL